MKIAGIYKIQSILYPEKIYIGSGENVFHRFSSHECLLKTNSHFNNKLQNHVNKYGINDLVFSIEMLCKKEELIKYEQKFIDKLHPWFNILQIANSSIGVKRSEETRKKYSYNNKKRIWKEESKNKIREFSSKRNFNHFRKVINTDTGEIFNSIVLAALSIGVNKKTLWYYLNNRRPNKTNLKYYELQK